MYLKTPNPELVHKPRQLNLNQPDQFIGLKTPNQKLNQKHYQSNELHCKSSIELSDNGTWSQTPDKKKLIGFFHGNTHKTCFVYIYDYRRAQNKAPIVIWSECRFCINVYSHFSVDIWYSFDIFKPVFIAIVSNITRACADMISAQLMMCMRCMRLWRAAPSVDW